MPRKRNSTYCAPEIKIDEEISKIAIDQIESARKAKGLTLADVAEKTGIPESTLSTIKPNITRTSVENILLLAKLLDLSLDELFNMKPKNNNDPITDTMLNFVKIIDSDVMPPLELKCEKISEHEREYSVRFHFRKCIDANGEFFSEEYPIYRRVYDFLSDYLDLIERLKGNDILSKEEILKLCLKKHSPNS